MTAKAIAIFQHTVVGEPGSIAGILHDLGHESRVIRIVDGESVPEDPSEFSGLVFMGGYMGVHDDFPWIPLEQDLIRGACARGIPVIGHCLGSQLVAQALGGSVGPNARPEIGWQALMTENHEVAREWWGAYAGRDVQTFQWHADTFQPPEGAVSIAHGAYCPNQAFVFNEAHVMLQSHLEMTPALVELSLRHNGSQLSAEYEKGNPSVSNPADVRSELKSRTDGMRVVLRRLYGRWVKNCA